MDSLDKGLAEEVAPSGPAAHAHRVLASCPMPIECLGGVAADTLVSLETPIISTMRELREIVRRRAPEFIVRPPPPR
jgi:hypothetical protein